MENSTLSPAAVTQKVIAMQTTRKEVCQKLLSDNYEKKFAEKLEKALDQNLSGNEIKKSITKWNPDFNRV